MVCSSTICQQIWICQNFRSSNKGCCIIVYPTVVCSWIVKFLFKMMVTKSSSMTKFPTELTSGFRIITSMIVIEPTPLRFWNVPPLTLLPLPWDWLLLKWLLLWFREIYLGKQCLLLILNIVGLPAVNIICTSISKISISINNIQVN